MSSKLTQLGTAIWRRMLHLDQPLLACSDADSAAEAERNYRWNLTVNIVEGAVFWIGTSFISASTLVPLFISKLTSSPLVIGLAAVIAQAGWYLPQLFTAGYIERLPRKKPCIVELGIFAERMPTWLWPLAALLAAANPTLALAIFFLGYAWHTIGAGAVAPAWQDLIAAFFPVNRRGRVYGTMSFLGSGLGMAGALLASWLLSRYPFPTSFVYSFLIAAVCILISWFFFALTREPARPPTAAGRIEGRPFSRLVTVVRHNDNYRRFLAARLLLAASSMGAAFITVSAVGHWRVPDSTVGLYTAALLLGQTGANLLAGWLADRWGHKVVLEVASLGALAAFGLAWLAPTADWYYAAFVLWGGTFGATGVSGLLITMEFCEPAQRPTYVGVTNTALGLVYAAAPLAGGILAEFSFDWVFVLSAAAGLMAWVAFRWFVQDPRKLAQAAHPALEQV
jgi:MFS family permease